jgi:hypothetical protein
MITLIKYDLGSGDYAADRSFHHWSEYLFVLDLSMDRLENCSMAKITNPNQSWINNCRTQPQKPSSTPTQPTDHKLTNPSSTA